MEEEIEELKEEVMLLTRKVELLEKKDNHRRAYSYAKILIKLILTLLVCFGLYLGYHYVVNELPNMIEDKIKELNPLKKYT